MELKGLCNICGKAGLLYSCSLCGRMVCNDCITLQGACKSCIRGRTMSIDDYKKRRGPDTM